MGGVVLIRAAILAGVYFLAALAGVSMLQQGNNISPLWPATGILMALLIRAERKNWPVYILAVIPGGVLADFWSGHSFLVSVGLVAGDILDSLIGASLLRRRLGQAPKFTSLVAFAYLIGVGLVAPIAGASVGASVLYLAYGAPLVSSWLHWWLSVFAAVVLVSPAILLWSPGWLSSLWAKRRMYEWGALLVCAVISLVLIFHQSHVPLLFAIIPVLLWAAIRFGPMESAAINVVMAAFGSVMTLLGLGTIAIFDGNLADRILLLQIYLVLMAIGPSLTVAIALVERDEANRRSRLHAVNLQALLDHSPMTINLRNLDNRYVIVNEKFAQWYGLKSKDVLGKKPHDIFPKEMADRAVAEANQVIRENTTKTSVYDVTFHDGKNHQISITRFPVKDDQGDVVAVGSFAHDISKEKQVEEQLRQAQKMEVVGQLTGGIAHDFNNLLSVMIGNLEMVLDDLPKGSAASPKVARAFEAAERGEVLIQRLLAFSRQQPLQPRIVNLNATIQGMEHLLRRSLGEQINLEVVVAAGLWPCEVDPSQIENALLNLAVNARDAMPEGGKLTIETGNARLDDDYVALQADVVPGQYVMIAVTDTGSGMSDEVKEKAFEPFFTTKGRRGGSGLGLSMVQGFVKQSRGHIKIYSEIGLGTTIKIYLPRCHVQNEDAVAEHHEPDIQAGHGELILVVEDDTAVAAMSRMLLEELGYRVLSAPDGQEALEVARQNPSISLLLTDVVLPGAIGGRQVADAVKILIPGVKVLFMSGYTANAIVHHGRVDPGVELLQKPFRKADLARAVRRALENSGKAPEPR